MAIRNWDKASLDDVFDSAWAMLKRGAARSTDPFHRPVLATGRSDGCNLRTVILRHADAAGRTLICFADLRSPKIAEIREFGQAGWLFYHPRQATQLRIHGPASVHSHDSIADALWKRVGGFSRLNFCTAAAPGTPLERPSSGLSTRLLKDLPKALRGDAGRENFAAIVGRVARMDWLKLRPSGNLRARFGWEADRLEASWIVP